MHAQRICRGKVQFVLRLIRNLPELFMYIFRIINDKILINKLNARIMNLFSVNSHAFSICMKIAHAINICHQLNLIESPLAEREGPRGQFRDHILTTSIYLSFLIVIFSGISPLI